MNNELTTKIVDANKSPELFDICPYCNKEVTFLPYDKILDIKTDFGICTNYDYECSYKGIRQCSNPKCKSIFSVNFNFHAEQSGYGDENGYIETYDETIDNLITLPTQDKCVYLKSLPKNVASSFIEAQKCYYNSCYIASAIMIRKTLEEICANHNIKNGKLNKKIETFLALEKIAGKLGKEFDILREFGNDGAHQLKYFNEINKQAVDRALKVLQHALEIIYDTRPTEYQKAIDDLERHKKSEAKNLPF